VLTYGLSAAAKPKQSAAPNVAPKAAQKGTLSRISVSIPEALVTALDRLVVRRGFPSRSHAIALVLRQFISNHRDLLGEESMVGTITILHNDLYDVNNELAVVRQRRATEIISSMSSQLAHGQTLAVMLARGSGQSLKAIGEEVGRLRGVTFAQTQLVAPVASPLPTSRAILGESLEGMLERVSALP
jgi:CopG family nickel-responsive transcriptional regulator